ncbi:MAG: S-layer homology domain-containing protein, partial [Clostridia bacterium]|nr:S-layer homology domain-containing protein [Clostridia bacterium]
RFIGFIGMLPTWDVTAPSSFSDVKKIGSWARESVDSLRTSGIIAGNNGNFDPKKTLSRAEAATILARLHRMKENLRLEDPIEKSYLTGDGKLHFLGAWDLYYSGTALNSGYNGTKVDESGEIPTLVGDADGRSFRLRRKTYVDDGTETTLRRFKPDSAGDCWYSLDTKILNVKLTDYPIVRFGISAREASVGIDLPDGTSAASLPARGEEGYIIADLSEYAARADASTESLVNVSSDSDFGITSAAFFKTEADAEAFTLTGFDLSKPTESRVDITEAGEKTIDEYNAMVDERIKEINSLPDLDPADYNTCYYISTVRGDDKNDGLAPDRPVKTEDALYDIRAGGTVRITKAKPGDAVFIERGSKIQGFTAQPGVAYSAYGKGEKPIIHYALNINGSMEWEKTEFDNIWKLSEKIPYREDRVVWYDVGNVAFTKDGTDGWGVKVLTTDPKNTFNTELRTVDNGIVSTGFEYYDCPERLCRDASVLQHNLEYIQDYDDGALYLYFDKGNPGEYFDNIVIAMREGALGIEENTTGIMTRIHNLSLRHSGGCTVGISSATDVSITGCDILWTGGSLQEYEGTVRYGNAIQNWGPCERFNVSDCHIYQAYDAGITTQAGGPSAMRNAYFRDNVLEYCNMTFELFTGNGGDTGFFNTFISGNMIRYAGLGLGSQTPEQERKGTFVWGSWSRTENPYPIENFVVENNVCLLSSSVSVNDCNLAFGDHAKGNIYRNNTYIVDTAHGYQLRGYTNLADDLGQGNTFYPATEQYLQYLRDMGIEIGSHFIFYDDYFDESTAAGANRHVDG